MSKFRKLSEIISVDDSGSNTIFCINGQWTFILPVGLSYGVDEALSLIEGGVDLSGDIKPLVIKEDGSVYEQAFCAAIAEHYTLTGDYTTIADCKYDNRFLSNEGINRQKVIVDEDDFYVDLIFNSIWPFGIEVEIRLRGENIIPYNISTVVKFDNEDQLQRTADYFAEIAKSVCLVQAAKKSTTTKKIPETVSDPNCIMSGTTLQRYIGTEGNVVLPEGITELADNIFSGRDDLRSIVIPKGVTVIGRRAFENCYNLKNVVLPNTIKEIGGYAFADCHELEGINLGEKLKYISDSVFTECYKLPNVVIPKTAKYIDSFAFKNCQAFTQIVLPEGITSIGFDAFSFCTNLEYLYIPASVTEIRINFGRTPFDDCNKLTIHCPEGSYVQQFAIENRIRYEIADKPKKIAPTSAPTSVPTSAKPIAKDVVVVSETDKIESKRLSKMGENLADNGQTQQAISYFEQALQLNPYNLHAVINNGLLFENSDSVLEKSIKIRKQCVEPVCKLLNEMSSFDEEIEGNIAYIVAFIWGFSKSVQNEKITYITRAEDDLYAEIIKNLGEAALYIGDQTIQMSTSIPHGVEALKVGITLCYNELEEYKNGKATNYLNKIRQHDPNFVIGSSYKPYSNTTEQQQPPSSGGGCYIATCVYGSYDCPQVWTLRRYRDNKLSGSCFGRLFIKTYYAISPKLVKMFGKTKWFRSAWKVYLDAFVKSLQEKGYEDMPYDDR